MNDGKIAKQGRIIDIDRAVPTDILDWVEEQMAFGCSGIVMRQRADSSSDIVRSWDLVGADARLVTASIDDTAHSEGRYMRGPTLFVLYSQLPNARDFVARKTIRVEGEMFASSGETEAPNQDGIISMFMRHTDASMKISLGHTAHIIEQYKGMLSAAHRRIEDLERELSKVAADREAIRLHEHGHSLEIVKAQDDMKNNEMLREQVGLIVPILANKFLKANVGARSPVVQDAAISALMGSFTDEQLASLAAVLTPEQFVAVHDLYMAYAAANTKDKDVAAQAKAAQQGVHAGANGGAAPSAAAPPGASPNGPPNGAAQ